jgi:hypothetical protein
MSLRRILPIPALLAIALTAGCGSSSGAKPTALVTTAPVATTAASAPAPVTAPRAAISAKKAAFLKAGNKICTTMNAKTDALGSFPAKGAAQSAFLLKTVAVDEHALKQLRALKTPAGDAAKVKALYAEIAKLDTLAKSAAKDLKAGNSAAGNALITKAAGVGDKANADYIAYGLTVCGS